jgi:hypothetical protein
MRNVIPTMEDMITAGTTAADVINHRTPQPEINRLM